MVWDLEFRGFRDEGTLEVCRIQGWGFGLRLMHGSGCRMWGELNPTNMFLEERLTWLYLCGFVPCPIYLWASN